MGHAAIKLCDSVSENPSERANSGWAKHEPGHELISKGSLWFDPFFMLCIMRDIAEGLRYLHGSFIESHGRLRSECCLVTDSWQVKICDYGIGSLREDERLKKKPKSYVTAKIINCGAYIENEIWNHIHGYLCWSEMRFPRRADLMEAARMSNLPFVRQLR
ncbi:hypothetical protein OSTOST_06646 [Ostertagia ostertagi]